MRTLHTIDVGYGRDGPAMLQVDPIGSDPALLEARMCSSLRLP